MNPPIDCGKMSRANKHKDCYRTVSKNMKKIIGLYKRIPVTVRASIWFVVCSVLQKAIAFLTTPIFTRIMSTEQYGQVTIYNSWVEIFMIFATLDIFYGVYNNALTKYPEDRDRVTSSMQGLCTTLTVVLLLIYLILQKFVNRLTGMSTNITLFLFGELLFVPAFRFWSTRERFDFKYRKLVIFSLIMALLSPAMGIPAVLYFEEKGYARIITLVLSQVIIAVGLYISNFKKGRTFFHKQYWKYALAFNLPLIPHYLSSTVLNQCDRIMIDRMCGTDKAGIYGLAYTVGAMIIIFNQAIMNTFTPYSYQKLKKQDYTEIRYSANFLVIIIAVISVGILTVAPEIMAVLGDERYSEGVWIIAPISASIFFRFVYGLYGCIEFYYEENYFIMVASTICAVVNIITNYIFIKMFGFLAAGYTTLGCYILYAISHYIFSQKVLQKHSKIKTLFDNRLILVSSIAVIAFSSCMMALYPFRLIRFLLIFALLVFTFIYRKSIIDRFKKIKNQ